MRTADVGYYEIRKGWREVFLMKEGVSREIACTDDDYVIVGIGYTEADRQAVIDFADEYDREIIWS